MNRPRSQRRLLPRTRRYPLGLALVFTSMAFCVSVHAAGLRNPRCEVQSGANGGPAILVGDATFSPIMFTGNNQFGRDEILLEELELAAKGGVPLFSFQVYLGDRWSSEQAAETIDRFCSAHPDGYFYVRMWLGADGQWLAEHPEACVVRADGARLSWASPASPVWRERTARLLRGRVREIAEGPHGDRFIGVCLTNMQTGEWFYHHTNDFMDYSQANLAGFRHWLRGRYGGDSALRDAWGEPLVRLDTASFPPPEERDQGAWGPFRDPVVHARAADMARYQADLVADTIAYFARVVKETTGGRSLVGAFYGYTFELNNNGPRALAGSGHLALGRLLQCEDVDLVHAPFSYFERRLGEPGHLHLPVDSLPLHGKLAILEDDTYTHLSSVPEAGLIAPGWKERTEDLEQTFALTRRNFGLALTHRCGVWYFDLLSDGRWNDRAFWESAGILRRMAAELRDTPVFEPEVAFVAGESEVHLLRATTWPHLRETLSHWRAELDRLGTPVGYYLQNDLPLLPESIKLLVLATPYALSEAEREAVHGFLKRRGVVVWVLAPGLYAHGRLDAAHIEDVTGIPVTARFGAGIAPVRSRVSEERWQPPQDSAMPRFVARGRGDQVLAFYEDTEEPCVVARPRARGLSVYTGVSRLPLGVLKALCGEAGVHIYRSDPGMVGVAGPYLFVHTGETGEVELRWPSLCRKVERVIPLRRVPMVREGDTWQDRLEPFTTAVYRCTEFR